MVGCPDGHRAPRDGTRQTRPSRGGLAVTRVDAGNLHRADTGSGGERRHPGSFPIVADAWAARRQPWPRRKGSTSCTFTVRSTARTRPSRDVLRRPYVFSPHSGYDPVSLRRSRRTEILLSHPLRTDDAGGCGAARGPDGHRARAASRFRRDRSVRGDPERRRGRTG